MHFTPTDHGNDDAARWPGIHKQHATRLQRERQAAAPAAAAARNLGAVGGGAAERRIITAVKCVSDERPAERRELAAHLQTIAHFQTIN